MRILHTRHFKVLLVVLLCALILVQRSDVGASGPLALGSATFGVDGGAFVWANPNLTYTTDGPAAGLALGSLTAAQADARIVTQLAKWTNLTTSTVSFAQTAGMITADGDVNTVAEMDAIDPNVPGSSCAGNPVIYDSNGFLTINSLGADPNSLLGFAGGCTLTGAGQITSGWAFFNGNVVTNAPSDLAQFDATVLHEFGHFAGLGHTQANNNCAGVGFCANGSDDSFGWPTMMPIAFGLEENVAGQAAELTLAEDDIAGMSNLYPDIAQFNATYATISGTIFFSDATTPVQGVNVLARQVNDPLTMVDESRRCVFSSVSGYRFTESVGQNITGDNTGGSPFGSRNLALRGSFDIVVRATSGGECTGATVGQYNLSLESIDSRYAGGSSVGPHNDAPMPMPGTAPAPGMAIMVNPGGVVGGNNFTLVGTAPTLDANDSVLSNGTIANATPKNNGTTTASISPLGATPDIDVYSFTALANTTVTIEVFARRAPHNDFLDSVVEVVDSGGVRVPTGCDSNFFNPFPTIDTYDGIFDDPCIDDDISLAMNRTSGERDSRLFFRSATGGTFFIRVFDWRGDARPDFLYDLVVTGAGQAPPPPGCTKDFDNGGGNNDWNTATNWNPDGVPGATDDVCIGAFTVNHASGATTIDTIASLTGTLNVTGGTLTPTTSVTVNGGTLNQNGGAVTTGTLTLSSGVLQGTGTLTANINQTGGEIRPGTSTGILNVTGNFTQAVGGTIVFEIFGTGGAGSPTGHDQLNVNGNVSVDGLFSVVLGGGFMPGVPAGPFTLATASGTAAGNNTTMFPADPPGGFWTDNPSTSNAFIVAVQALSTCTINFDNTGGNGLWQQANNWDTNMLPTATDDVCIGAFTVTKSASGGDSINSLTVDNAAGVFTLSDNLSLAAASTIGNGGFSQTSGTLSGAGSLTITGAFNWSGGTHSGAGATIISSPLNITGSVSLDGRTLTSNGTTNMAGSLLSLTLLNNAVFNNNGTFNADGDSDNVGGGGTFNNAGSFVRGVQATDFFVTPSNGFNNTGSVTVNTGALRLQGGGSCGGNCAGSWTVGNGTTLDFQSGQYDLTGSISGMGTWTINVATVNLNSSGSLTTSTTIDTGATLNVATGTTVNVPTLNLTNGTVAGAGAMTVGTMNWANGLLDGTGSTTVTTALNIMGGGATLGLNDRTLNNAGTVTTTNDVSLSFTGTATFNNQMGAIFNAADNSTFDVGGGTGQFNNVGTFNRITSPGTFAMRVPFNNTGSTSLSTGTLSLDGASGGGPYAVSMGATLSFGELGASNTLTSNITGAGTVQFLGGTQDLNGGTYNITGGTTINATVNFNAAANVTSVGALAIGTIGSGTANFVSGEAINPASVNMASGGAILTGTDNVTSNGVFDWNGGTISGTGSLTIGAPGTLNISGAGNQTLDGRTITQNGTVNMTDSGFIMTNGAVFNNAGTFNANNNGTINFSVGTPNFNNSGTFNKGGAGTVSMDGIALTNTGTVNHNAGTLTLNTSGGYMQTAGLTSINAAGANLNVPATFQLNGGTLRGIGTVTGLVDNNSGTVAPGLTPGTLTINGTYRQFAGGTLLVELTGLTPGTQYDVVNISGPAMLAGTLSVQSGGFNPTGIFTIMTFASRTGDFTNFVNGTPNAGLTQVPGANNYQLNAGAAACGINSAASGDWANAATWNPAQVPTVADNVCVDANSHAVTVSAGAQTANSLTATGTANPFTLSGGSLTLAAASSIAGAFNQSGGTLGGAGSLSIGGLFTWNGGTQDGAGTTSANGGTNLDGTVILDRALNLAGTNTWSSGQVNTTASGSVILANGASFAVNGSDGGTFGPTFTNNGLVTRSMGVGAADFNVFNNSGTVNVTTATLQFSGGGGTSTGSFTVASPGQIFFSFGTHNLNAGSSVTGDGDVFFLGVGTTNIAGTYNVTGTTLLNLVSGSVNFNAAATTNVLAHNFGTLGGTGTLTVTGLFTWPGGTQTGSGTTIANGGITFSTANTKTLSGRTLNNTGAAVVSGTGNISITNGAVFNNNGSFDLQTDAGIILGGTAPQTFNNNGTFTKSAGAASSVTVDFNNAGTMTAASGALTFSGVYAQTAGVTRLNGGSITKTGTALTIAGGLLEGVNGSTITGDVSNTGGTVGPGLTPGTLNIAGNYTQGAGGTLTVEFTGAGSVPGTDFDVLAITGSATLGGTLSVQPSPPAIAPSGNFQIMTFGSRVGDFIMPVTNGTANPALTPMAGTNDYILSFAAVTSADLSVTKTDSLDPVVVGQNITYTVTVANSGPDDATSVTLTDTLPATGIALGTVTPSQGSCGAPVGNVLTCNLGTINNGAMATVSIDITPLAAGTLSNTAAVSSASSDPVPANNSATEMTTVNQAATSTALISSVNPSVFGEPVTFTATVTSPGGSPTGTVNFFNGMTNIGSGALNAMGQATLTTSALAVGTHTITATYAGDTNFTTSTSAPVMQTVTPAGTTTALMSSVNPSVFGESVTFTATVTVNAPGAGTPTGTVTFGIDGTPQAPVALNAMGQATLSTSTLTVGGHNITATYNGETNFSASPASLMQTVNQAATSTTVVSSLNPSNSGQAVTFTATVTAVAPGAGIPTGTVDFFDGMVLLGNVALNAGGQAAFTTSALTPGTHSITATYNGDANFTTSTSPVLTQTVNGVADLSVTKSDTGSDPVNVGQNIVYTVTIANAGPDPATSVVLTDTLPAAVAFVNAVPSQGGACTLVGVTLTCPIGTINSGATANVVITVTTGALAAPSVTNTASVTSSSVDPNAANNTVMETTTVNPIADLSITKTDAPDPVSVGSNITYTITVTNNGPSPATGVTVTDVIPAGLNFVTASGPVGVTCLQAAGTITCTLAGMLNSGASITATVVVQTTAAAVPSVSNTATVSSAIPDPNAANNSATAVTTVSATPPATDFSLSVLPINNNVIVGQSGMYTVTVTSIPAGSNFAAAVDLACFSPTGTCTLVPNQLPSGMPSGTSTLTVESSGLLATAPPVSGPAAPPAASPLLALWTFLAGLLLVSVGCAGKRMQLRRFQPCLTFGLVLLVVAAAIGQSACATGVKRQVSGPYTVTVTATSGSLSHSATTTLNVTQP